MKSVLIMRLTAMGDVAMTAPIVASACRANPNVHFSLLSTPLFEPFFEPLPNFTFIGTNIRKEKGGLPGLWRLFCELRARGGAEDKIPAKFDLVLDFHDVLRTKVLRNLFRMAGVRVFSIDKGRASKRDLVSGRQRRQLKHMTERYADVFRSAGIEVPADRYVRSALDLPQAAMPWAAHRADEYWIGISPFAQHRSKMYPSDRMIRVVEGLLRRHNVRVFFFGGGSVEAEAARLMIEAATQNDVIAKDRCHNVINVMPLRDEMALMSHLDCMVSMDSSNMHICSLFGVRVVSLWGGTHPFAGFLGYGQDYNDAVQRPDIDCRPCSIYGNVPCLTDDYKCFDISPNVVIDRVFVHCKQAES